MSRREIISIILQELTNELCPHTQAGYLAEAVNKIIIILDNEVKAAQLDVLKKAKAIIENALSRAIEPSIADLIEAKAELVEAINDK